MKKILFGLLGSLFIAISLFFDILYLNLISFGYTFSKYVYFISRRVECLIIIPGIILNLLALKKKG